MKFQELGKGFIRKREKRIVGLFIDGTGLDRATRRINRKVDLAALVRGVTSGTPPTIARYYTLVPYEDDSRQRAFLDAVARAGMSVIVKRLPPKGITRQVSVDLEMAADMVAFALGHSSFSKENEYLPGENSSGGAFTVGSIIRPGRGPIGGRDEFPSTGREAGPEGDSIEPSEDSSKTTLSSEAAGVRSVVVVCPSRELAYPMSIVKDVGGDSTTADFGQFNTGDVLKSAAKWIDLSDSETIWRD